MLHKMYSYDFYEQFGIYGIKFNYDLINNKKRNIILPKYYNKMRKEDIVEWNKDPFYYNYYLNKKLKNKDDCPLCFSLKGKNVVVIDTDSPEQTEKILNHKLVKGKPFLRTRNGAHIPVLILDYEHNRDIWKDSLIAYQEKLDIICHQVFETEKRIVHNHESDILSITTLDFFNFLGKPLRNFNFDKYTYVKTRDFIENTNRVVFIVFFIGLFLLIKI